MRISGHLSQWFNLTHQRLEIKVGALILDRERAIIRQNALTNAVNFHASRAYEEKELQVEDVIETAKLFEAYTSGDADKEKVEQLIAGSEAA